MAASFFTADRSGHGGFLERTRLALTLCLVLLTACDRSGGNDSGWSFRAGGRMAYPVPGEGRERVTAEVLNATERTGAARAGTRRLREAGIDVVFYGNAPAAAGTLDSTSIVVLRGSPEHGERIRKALGTGRVVLKTDSTRLLDVRVLLGADFRPPREFNP
jgi:hypothetical protein